MNRRVMAEIVLVVAVSCSTSVSNAQEDQGAYLARIMDCGGCHTPGAMKGQPDMSRYLGGSDVGFEIPGVGVFYPPNLTSDTDRSGLLE